MSRHDPVVRLKHMRDAALDATQMVAGRSREDLDSDDMLAPALKYQMVIIGEAASQLPESVMDRSPDTPWRDIIGMRHVIVHGYDVVDLDVVWGAATKRLPELLSALETLIPSLEAEDDNGRAGKEARPS